MLTHFPASSTSHFISPPYSTQLLSSHFVSQSNSHFSDLFIASLLHTFPVPFVPSPSLSYSHGNDVNRKKTYVFWDLPQIRGITVFPLPFSTHYHPIYECRSVMYRVNPYMVSRCRLLYRKMPLCRTIGRFSSTSKIVLTKKHHYVATTTLIMLGATSAVVGGIAFLNRTHRLELLEYARAHRKDILKEATWRDCLAVGLVDMYRQPSGAEIIYRMHCGMVLGRWVTDDR